MKNKIYPCLWFDGQAKAAAELYCAVFGQGTITVDTSMVVNFELHGQKFMGLNGGPQFQPNPSLSFYAIFETEAEIDAAWQQLSEGGSTLMPLNKYPWSEKYGWLSDRFGVSWQLVLGNLEEVGQKITPLLMFANAQQGHAETAIAHYSSLFEDTSIRMIARFEENEPIPGKIKHSQFFLNGQLFMAMDGPGVHKFNFSEGVSLMVDCMDQTEVDHFWDGLTANGEEGQCGWLKDQFGVSWQIVPRQLMQALSNPDPAAAQYAMNALLQMKKIEIAKLSPVAAKPAITVQTTVDAPIAKVWSHWTEPAHIVNWNHASDDWHAPKASNDLRPSGRFVYTMAAKDGSFSFDFSGTYHEVIDHQRIAYTTDDDREVSITFEAIENQTKIIETFEAESVNSLELQQGGWQAILDNFKKYTEQ
jgi:predicted 3-demethylubiquinone-9 3-methyltransferase (glyoxalase superfamily)/uncharacterized protein YndB with AHSA1/START domain